MSGTRPDYRQIARLVEDGDTPVEIDSLFSPSLRGAPVEIEIGPGRGGFLHERALVRPEARLLGLEVRLKWAAIFDGRLAKAGLGDRVRVFAADARSLLPRLTPSGSVDAIFVHFPDPWWKKRHERRLVVGDTFMREAARLLKPSGELFVQTDVEERADRYRDLFEHDSRFAPAGDVEGSPMLAENPYGARSPRERRADADGLPIARLRFRRREGA